MTKARKTKKKLASKSLNKPALSPIVRQVIADAKIDSEASKQIFGEALDLAINQVRLLRKKQTVGTILVDEARSIPALMSNIKRTLDAIGVTQISDDDPGEL